MVGRVLRTGLLGKARALFHGLSPKGEHPSRIWTAEDKLLLRCDVPGRSAETGSPLIRMSFGYYGEIFCLFADGSRTCVWPNGEPVPPSRTRLTR
jgi:hypothetical protein